MSATAERDVVLDMAGQAGWRRRNDERVDYFSRDADGVRVHWGEGDAISGGALYDDGMLMAYTRDLDTVKRWLKR
ncbi:hypothetical protein [Mycolicibacterium grossiae]|uniref:Uncharacterized protein n=1 Tax=Mycolicibacterium grossiae TaxID=1552759 RepID=A0A1E8Q4X3_9MYCO|nr:hypothetical protein [Mycolicibacterium grossiae]OFJ53109.1 hypothetical protein BEL07_13810 [Mycolicibacterium grossiae]QEM44785.1 hypothetical protein FZ046_08300 [Mycolicibacterium grossiae]